MAIPAPPLNLAAVGLIRAVVVDDPDAGLLIASQHGGGRPGSDQVVAFMLAQAAVAARAMLSANGYNIERTLRILDTWAAEYADDAAGTP